MAGGRYASLLTRGTLNVKVFQPASQPKQQASAAIPNNAIPNKTRVMCLYRLQPTACQLSGCEVPHKRGSCNETTAIQLR